MGADFVMMGRYFAMTGESPTPKVSIKGRMYKPYWCRGSNRARNWQRYSEGAGAKMHFEEGIDGCVPVVGSVKEVLAVTLEKLRATMCNPGSNDLREFNRNAVLTLVLELSIEEGGTSNIIQVDSKFEDTNCPNGAGEASPSLRPPRANLFVCGRGALRGPLLPPLRGICSQRP